MRALASHRGCPVSRARRNASAADGTPPPSPMAGRRSTPVGPAPRPAGAAGPRHGACLRPTPRSGGRQPEGAGQVERRADEVGGVRVGVVRRDASSARSMSIPAVAVGIGEAVHREQQRVARSTGATRSAAASTPLLDLGAHVGDPRLHGGQVGEPQREVRDRPGHIVVAPASRSSSALAVTPVRAGCLVSSSLARAAAAGRAIDGRAASASICSFSRVGAERVAELGGRAPRRGGTGRRATGVGGEERGALERLEGDEPPTARLGAVGGGFESRLRPVRRVECRRRAVPHAAVRWSTSTGECGVHRLALGRRSALVDRRAHERVRELDAQVPDRRPTRPSPRAASASGSARAVAESSPAARRPR